MPTTELVQLIWGNRPEPLYSAHPREVRTDPMPKDEALHGLETGWSFFAPVPRIAVGNTKKHCAKSFNWLWIDIDREAGADPNHLVMEMRSSLGRLNLWPTAIVYSGNRGIHAYWMLDQDLAIEQIEAYNKALAQILEGDSCHDRTHFFRHPGTINSKSGNLARIMEISGEIIPVSRLDVLGPVNVEDCDPAASATAPRPIPRRTAAQDDAWLRAAESLTGWKEPEHLKLGGLAEWEKCYMTTRPSKGWTRHGQCRSEVEQSLVNRLAGKQFGASDRQIHAIADEGFAKHRDRRVKYQNRYIDQMIVKARRMHFERGWITSPLGGPPRKRDALYRQATVDDLNDLLDLVHGQPRKQLVAEIQECGWSQPSAYRYVRGFILQGLVVEVTGRLYRPHQTPDG